MRNPRNLYFYIILLILNLNLITQIIPSSSYGSETKIIPNTSDFWASIVNTNRFVRGTSMKYKNDNIYIVGKTYYGGRIYTTKYNNSGVKLWENYWGTLERDYLLGYDIDSEENLYVVSNSETGSSLDPEMLYLTKYSHSGELVWTKKLNQTRYCYSSSIKIDQNNFIYVAGALYNSSGNDYRFLLKLNSSGNILWNRQLEMNGEQIELDSKNDIYICGGNGDSIYYLNKYSSSGSKLWSQEVGELYHMSSMKFDSMENIILKAYAYNSSTYDDLLWLMKFNNSGGFINKLEVATIHSDYQYNCDYWFIDDNAYVFKNYPASLNSILLKYNSSFQLCWNVSLNEHYTTTYFSYGNTNVDIGIDSQDNILFFYNNPRGNYTSEDGTEKYDSEDISILKLNSSGQIISHNYWGGPYHDEPIQIIIDPLDNIYLLCTCRYVDIWNVYRDPIILVKNPEINGIPPPLGFIDINSYYILSFMGVMSVISLFLLISIIRPRRINR